MSDFLIPVLLKSDCGRFLARHTGSTWYDLLDQNGNFICRTTFCINRSSTTRIAFEIGSGEARATFSFPRYPKWFRRRWVECWDIDCNELAQLVERAGGIVLVCFKMAFSCDNCIGFRASAEVARAVDRALIAKGVGWTARKKSRMWGIECPDEARWEKRREVPRP